jgi:cytoskeletal protein CcmA (bactofilin family)
MSPRTIHRLFVVLLVVSLLAVGPASAQSVRGGGTVTVPAGTVHEGNLNVISGTVVIDGTVDGSIEGVAGSIVVTGTVTGDVEAAAGSVTIRGTVEGNIESATGSVSVLEGARVGGNIEAGSGSLSVDGTVDGQIRAGVGTLTIGDTARIGGDLTYSADTVSIADGAEIGGTVERVDSLSVDVGLPFVGLVGLGAVFAGGVFAFFGFLVNFLLGAALLVAAPRFAGRVTETGRSEAVESGVYGLAAFVGIPVALVVVAITIVGIPLSIAGLFAYLLLLWVAFVYGALITGTWLLSLADYESRWGGLAVGLVAPAVLGLVSLGGLLSFFYLLLGLGAFVRAVIAVRRGRKRRPTGTAASGEDEETGEGPQPA